MLGLGGALRQVPQHGCDGYAAVVRRLGSFGGFANLDGLPGGVAVVRALCIKRRLMSWEAQ